ncbi:MAG: hypothetical protein A2Y33_06640 [Spirochaetes bacterium GWF1_51_8]|nr:MAG: hypothetical protein A2Y33_06640 [Spirochaetes bacterium GWF1_51_8]
MFSQKKSLGAFEDPDPFKDLDCIGKLFFWKNHVFDILKNDLFIAHDSVLILRSPFMIHDEVECEKKAEKVKNNQEVS